MWKIILNNINQLLLSNWKSLFWLVVGVLVGSMLISCSVVQPAWDGVKNGTSTVVGTGEEVVSNVYGGAKGLVVDGVEAVEGVVNGGYDLVTGPFTDNKEDMAARRAHRAQRAERQKSANPTEE